MRIQHNIMAMNAYRNYTSNTSALSKNLEKLSSGYKINRAGDDAAGLAISEKMRAQITGLKTAQKNSKDGISLVQTAEGALTEVHSMLNRMVELADQSANGTYQDATDRTNLQKEITQLKSEIDRISEATNFNGIKLLNGDLSGSSVSFSTGTLGGFPAVAAAGNVPVPGTNTILHQDAVAEVKPEFTVDLTGMTFEAGATTSAITFKVGGETFSIKKGANATTAFAVGDSMTASSIATNLAILINKNDSTIAAGTKSFGGVKIGSMAYKATAVNGKITFSLATKDSSGGNVAAANAQVVKGTDLAANGVVTATAGTADTYTGFDLNAGNLTITDGKVKKDATLANSTFSLTADHIADGNKLTIGEKTYVFKVGRDGTAAASGDEVLIDMSDLADDATDPAKLDMAGARLTIAAAGNNMYSVGVGSAAGKITIREKTAYNGDAELDSVDGIKDTVELSVKGAATQDKSLVLQIGDTSDSFNQLKVSISKMDTTNLGINGVDISTQAGGKAAVDMIKAAINNVSSTRGDLGATQNRLEHTINNLNVMTENIQDAEANIRDVDVAEEMMVYTKNNILVQSAQAMLAQANQVPQGVLQLLQ